MRDHSSHICLESERAVEAMLEKASFEPHVEHVRTECALGRVLADDVRCPYDLPNKLGSRMDAIAVRYDDFADGIPDVSGWREGVDFEFANTGTAIEGDFDTCIVVEQVAFDGDRVVGVKQAPAERGAMTIPVGSRHQAGRLLLERGTQLTPARLAALGMAGVAQVPVVGKPRVAFIPTGNELVPLGTPLPEGKTFESNSLMVAAKLEQWGAMPYVFPIIGDDWGVIKQTVFDTVDEYDIVVLNAGSSKGSKDFNLEVLEEAGEVICHEVNHGPGHHSSYSLVKGVPVVGISGPPSGAEYTADWYLRPLVEAFLYGRPLPVPKIKARLAHDLPVRNHGQKPDGPRMFGAKRCRVEYDGEGAFTASLVERGELPELVGEDEADCFLRLYDELEGSPAGTEVELELRYPYTFPGSRNVAPAPSAQH